MDSNQTFNLKAYRFQKTRFSRLLRIFVVTTLLYSTLPTQSIAQVGTVTNGSILNLPVPGVMVKPTVGFNPTVLVGVKVYPDNPFRFDFIVDTGEDKLQGEELKAESTKLIKYFLASLTVPEDELWVNLSPYEKDRIIPEKFGITEMGKDLLAQDYLLKQLTASLIYPEDELGKNFWDKIYQKAYELYGTTNIPINTFNKVWIIPDNAVVYQNKDVAFVVESHLKVMLEGDYLALQNNLNKEEIGTDKLEDKDVRQLSDVSSQIVRDVILPTIEKEVNEGKNFAQLRQIFSGLILAAWYKKRLKESILAKVYADKNKVAGVDVEDKEIKDKIYDQYVEAFKQGVYNYIKDDEDPFMGKTIKRRYVSGGFTAQNFAEDSLQVIDQAQLATSPQRKIYFLKRLKNLSGPIMLAVNLLVATPSFTQDATLAQQKTGVTQKVDELKQIQLFIQGDTISFEIVSPQSRSSLGTDYKSYLSSEKLLGAWLPPNGSPYFSYVKTKTMNSIEFVKNRISPRYSQGESTSERGIENLIKSGSIDKQTAIILDSGGAHSVAMAVKLMKSGYQPVVMFDAIPHTKGANRPEQELATLLYFAEEVEKLRQQGSFNKNSPPVFILNTHRKDIIMEGDVNNTYQYSSKDFPDGKRLKELGITKIVYLNEGDQDGKINPSFQSPDRLDQDLKPLAKNWELNGIKILYTGISPWKEEGRGRDLFKHRDQHEDLLRNWSKPPQLNQNGESQGRVHGPNVGDGYFESNLDFENQSKITQQQSQEKIVDPEINRITNMLLSTTSSLTQLPIESGSRIDRSPAMDSLFGKYESFILNKLSSEQIRTLPLGSSIYKNYYYVYVQHKLFNMMVNIAKVKGNEVAPYFLTEASMALERELQSGGISAATLKGYGGFYRDIFNLTETSQNLLNAESRKLVSNMKDALIDVIQQQEGETEARDISVEEAMQVMEKSVANHLKLLEGEKVPFEKLGDWQEIEFYNPLTGKTTKLMQARAYSDGQRLIMGIADRLFDKLVVKAGLEDKWFATVKSGIISLNHHEANKFYGRETEFTDEEIKEVARMEARYIFVESYQSLLLSGNITDTHWFKDGGYDLSEEIPGIREFFDNHGILTNLLHKATIQDLIQLARRLQTQNQQKTEPSKDKDVQQKGAQNFDKSKDAQILPLQANRANIKEQKNPGGIDFNPANINLQTKGEGIQMPTLPTPVDPAQLEQMNIPGLYPVIFSVVPAPNLLPLLGLETNQPTLEQERASL